MLIRAQDSNIFNNSIKSLGYSEISQAFNMHFNFAGDKSENLSNFGGIAQKSINEENYRDEDPIEPTNMIGSQSFISKPSIDPIREPEKINSGRPNGFKPSKTTKKI